MSSLWQFVLRLSKTNCTTQILSPQASKLSELLHLAIRCFYLSWIWSVEFICWYARQDGWQSLRWELIRTSSSVTQQTCSASMAWRCWAIALPQARFLQLHFRLWLACLMLHGFRCFLHNSIVFLLCWGLLACTRVATIILTDITHSSNAMGVSQVLARQAGLPWAPR